MNFIKINNKRKNEYKTLPFILEKKKRIESKTLIQNIKSENMLLNEFLTNNFLHINDYPYLNIYKFQKQNSSEEFLDYKIYLEKFGIKTNRIIQTYIMIKNLNDLQREIIKEWINELNNKKSIYYILDAPAGTGKSFLIKTFISIINIDKIFTVFKHDLLNSYSVLRPQNTKFYTCTSFFQKYFNIHMFERHDNLMDDIFKFLCYGMEFFPRNIIIIVDEYTVINPFYIFLLLIICKILNNSLILIGDQYQHTSIRRSYYKKNSFDLIKNYMKIIHLKQQMRTLDPEYAKIILDIRDSDNFLDVILNNFKYNIDKKESFSNNTIYLSQIHSNLMDKLRRWDKIVNFMKAEYVVYNNKKAINVSYKIQHPKFPTSLYLKKDFLYKYIKLSNNIIKKKEIIVRFIEYDEKTDTCNVQDINDNIIYNIKRVAMLDCMPIDQLNSLKKLFSTYINFNSDLFQFPIFPIFCKTTYSVQGLTFPNNINLEIDTFRLTQRGAYVAFSRICYKKNLGKIFYYNKISNTTSKNKDKIEILDKFLDIILKNIENFKIHIDYYTRNFSKFIEEYGYLQSDS